MSPVQPLEMVPKLRSSPDADVSPTRSRHSVVEVDKLDSSEEEKEGSPSRHRPPTLTQCIGAAALYAISGCGITFINKIALSYYKFPSPAFLAFCQLLTTVSLVALLKSLGYVQYEDCTVAACRKIMPMPIFFLGNAICSLSGTKLVSIPTFTALRKVSMLFTMILERTILGQSSPVGIQASVFLMIFGAFVASSRDLNFNAFGYIYVMGNNVFTAGHYIVTKQKADMGSFGTVGSLFYCALLSLPVSFLLSLPELHRVIVYPNWDDWAFLVTFLLSTVMGCVVTFSTILCTRLNSGLTTSVVGCFRNIIPVYVGMLSVFDYSFNMINFAGHTISVFGAVLYSVLKLRQ